MIQKRDDQRRIDLLQVQSRGRDVRSLTGEFQEQFERVGIRIRGVTTGAALDRQSRLKEGSDVWRERRHGRPPMTKRSQRSAMSSISSGTASRYQYVSATLA